MSTDLSVVSLLAVVVIVTVASTPPPPLDVTYVRLAARLLTAVAVVVVVTLVDISSVSIMGA